MARGLGWMLAVGVGGALVTGCLQSQESSQAGRFNEPIHQKSQSPAGAAADTGQGGSGDEGVKLDKGWEKHSSRDGSGDKAVEGAGPYAIDRPQPIPTSRRAAPLGVGPGVDSSREMTEKQLKSE